MQKNRFNLKEFVDSLAKLRGISSKELVNKLGLSSYDELNQYLLVKSKLKLSVLYPSLSSILEVPQDDFDRIVKEGDTAPLIRVKDRLGQKEHSNNHNFQQKSSKNEPFIARLREKQGFTRDTLAEKLHTSVKGVARIENANHPNVRTLIRVAMALQVPIAKVTHYYHYSDKSVKQILQNAQRGARKHAEYVRKHEKLSSIGDYLLGCRHKLGLSQVKVSKKCHMGTATISRLETGKVKGVDVKIISKLTHLYKVPLMSALIRTKLYRFLAVDSPVYKLIDLCVKHNMSLDNLAKKVGWPKATLKKIEQNYQKYDSHLPHSVDVILTNTFNLPDHYFENAPKVPPKPAENNYGKKHFNSNIKKYVHKPKKYHYSKGKAYRNKIACRVPKRFRNSHWHSNNQNHYSNNNRNNYKNNQQHQQKNIQQQKEVSKEQTKAMGNAVSKYVDKLQNDKKSQNNVRNKLNTAKEEVDSFSKLSNANHDEIPHTNLEYHAKVNSLSEHVSALEKTVGEQGKELDEAIDLLGKIASGLGRIYHK